VASRPYFYGLGTYGVGLELEGLGIESCIDNFFFNFGIALKLKTRELLLKLKVNKSYNNKFICN